MNLHHELMKLRTRMRNEKGRSRAEAHIEIHTNARPCVSFDTYTGEDAIYCYPPYRTEHHDVEAAIKAANDKIDDLPSQNDARKAALLASLAGVIGEAKKLDLDVEFINPLVETMNRIAKNALIHQKETT